MEGPGRERWKLKVRVEVISRWVPFARPVGRNVTAILIFGEPDSAYCKSDYSQDALIVRLSACALLGSDDVAAKLRKGPARSGVSSSSSQFRDKQMNNELALP